MLCMNARGRASLRSGTDDQRIHRCRVQGVALQVMQCSDPALSPQHSFTLTFLLLPHLKAARVQDVNMSTISSSGVIS